MKITWYTFFLLINKYTYMSYFDDEMDSGNESEDMDFGDGTDDSEMDGFGDGSDDTDSDEA